MTDDRPRDDPADDPPRDRSDENEDSEDHGRNGPDDGRAGPEDAGNGSRGAGDGHDDASGATGAGEWITTLLQSLDRFDRLSGRGRGRGRTALDFDVSIGSGLDSLDDTLSRGRRSGGPPTNPRPDRESLGRRPRGGRGSSRSRRRVGPSGDHHVALRTYDDELILTADVAGVDREDVAVGFDDGELVVGVEGRELERVDVPWQDRTAEAIVRNGVLTARVEREAEPDIHD